MFNEVHYGRVAMLLWYEDPFYLKIYSKWSLRTKLSKTLANDDRPVVIYICFIVKFVNGIKYNMVTL